MPTKHTASEAAHAIFWRMSECTHGQTAGHVSLSSVKLMAGRVYILAGRGAVRCNLRACVSVFPIQFLQSGHGWYSGGKKKKKLNKDTLYVGSLYCFQAMWSQVWWPFLNGRHFCRREERKSGKIVAPLLICK